MKPLAKRVAKIKTPKPPWPTRVGVLDLESRKPVTFPVNDADIVCAIFREFEFDGRSYKQSGNTVHVAEYVRFDGSVSMKIFEKKILEFDGPIIGHNLLDYDLQLLNAVFSIKTILGNSIDLLILLTIHNDDYTVGLNLADLGCSVRHANKSKTAPSVPSLIKTEKWNELIDHCSTDIEVTFKVWVHLMKEKSVLRKGNYGQIRLSICELYRPYLSGEKPMIDYKTWSSLIKKNGRILERKRMFGRRQFVDAGRCISCNRLFTKHNVERCSNCSGELISEKLQKPVTHRAPTPLSTKLNLPKIETRVQS